MSTTSSATTTLYVNGRPAQDELARLRTELDRYKKQLMDIAADPSKGLGSKEWDEARKKIKATETELNRVTNNVSNVTRALSRLDKATPGELRKYLRQLKQELAGIERGSKAWDEHLKKIRAVQTEINKLNNEMKGHQSLWTRFADKMFAWGAAIQTVFAAVTGLKQSMRAAVEAFAEMDQEMANVRKYTGMTEEAVEELNGEFKNMDTRTSREGLNQLAQEAGRLGKQSKEDVLGFVRAADQINVALDDLGEGATLTLSKLTGLFGDEERYGTEQSLLKVGSVVNELSQNCSASAPYIAEFASRVGGVGAQAEMSVQQIMAYGAVLDTAQQKVEASSTALSQLIVKLYRDPAKYAAAAGLDVKKFTELVKNDANEAVLTLLETLHKAGGMDVLAPMFAEMGETGARSVQTLSVLAGKIDEVRAQQEAANKAFDDGTSITKEFNVQNNTVQAGLDKAKKRFNEMAVELGQKLAPAMKYAVTSSAAMMEALSVTVGFVSKHKKAIINLTVVLAALTIATKASAIATAYHTTVTKLATAGTALWNGVLLIGTTIQKTYTYVLGLAKVAQIAFTEGVTAARIAFAVLNATIKMNPLGLLLTAVTAVTLAIINLTGETDEYTEAVNRALDKSKGFNAETIKEQRELDLLFGKLDAATKGSKEYNEIKDKIISQYGQYLSGLINEKGEIIDLTAAYNTLNEAMRRNAQLKGIQAAREEIDSNFYKDLSKDLTDLQNTLESLGVSTREASSMVYEVEQAVISGKPVSQQTLTRLGSFGQNRLLSKLYSAPRPADIMNTISNRTTQRNSAIARLDAAEDLAKGKYRAMPVNYLKGFISNYDKVIKGESASAPRVIDGESVEIVPMTADEAAALKAEVQQELRLRGANTPQTPTANPPGGTYRTTGGSGTDKKGGGGSKTEDKFKAEKDWREKQIALAKISYFKGETDYEQHQQRLEQIDMDFANKLLERTDLTESERLDAQAKYWEAKNKLDKRAQAKTIADENEAYEDLRRQVQDDYLQNRISKEAYDMQMENVEFAHLRALTQLTKEGTEERRKAEETYRQRLVADQQKRQKDFEEKEKEHQAKLKQTWDSYFVTDEESKHQQYQTALALLDEVYKSELAKHAGNNEKKLELDKRYAQAKKKLHDEIFKDDEARQLTWNDVIGSALDKIFGEGTWAKYGETVKQAFASMSAMMQSFNQLAQVEAEVKIANLEKQYDREISMAEGNNRKVKALERKKEKETARIKAEAQRKEFAQQMMNAIASTALAAINAYASASKIAWWLGPVAAGLALAAGAVQIAAIKKQQEASEAKGFSEGGFTPKGPKDKAVGVVHAGEWVASQKLLANPVARPMIEALDYAQRNNTLGSLRPADVSRSVTAPAVIAGAASEGQSERLMVAVAAALGNYDGTMARLTDRLNEPFVTVNTVTGDMGIKEAQDEYQRLMNNTLPKSKRK